MIAGALIWRQGGPDLVDGDEVQNLAPPDQGVRRLTPTECERLQGFPDGWTIVDPDLDPGNPNPKPDAHRYSQMGNAVTVNVAEWIGHRLREFG